MNDKDAARLKRLARNPFADDAPLDQVERVAATLCARGFTLAEIARDMDIGPSMVNYHVRNVVAKLGLKNKRDLSRRAFANLRSAINDL